MNRSTVEAKRELLNILGWTPIDLSQVDGDPQRARTAMSSAEAASWWSTLFASAPCAIAIVDRRDRIVQVNHRLAELVGFTSAQMIGHCFNDISLPKVAADEAVLRSDGPHAAQQVSVLRTREGKPVWCRRTTIRRDSADGLPSGSICFLDELQSLTHAVREITSAIAHVGGQAMPTP